ncbi:MAG: hypothetical protein Q4G49_09875 [Paracoccus sp. (in: a-proteobacteria)]|nr:hypothetical protein [Paracoccus sp. (in: a-proteobacteria)]
MGPGLILNGLFKETVGRARPADITAFGGKRVFTPLLQFTDQCMSNCSFTPGEVGVTAACVMIVLVLFWRHLPRGARAAALSAGVALVCLSITLRVGLGRHFLSMRWHRSPSRALSHCGAGGCSTSARPAPRSPALRCGPICAR